MLIVLLPTLWVGSVVVSVVPRRVASSVVAVDLVLPFLGSLLFIYVVYSIGLKLMAGFSRPVPPPPPPGELRRVKLTYRCSLCGTEVRMVRAPNQHPEAPRCCMEDMDLMKNHDD